MAEICLGSMNAVRRKGDKKARDWYDQIVLRLITVFVKPLICWRSVLDLGPRLAIGDRFGLT